MNQLYSINSSNYTPISFRERYFYDYYEIAQSFLKTKLNANDIDRLLKPMLKEGGNITWHGKYNGDFKRLNEWDEKLVEKVKKELDDFIKSTQSLSSLLKVKPDPENKEWGNLIADLFHLERIIVINNNQGDWALLWGWDFMTKDENKLPKLEPSVKPIPPSPGEIITGDDPDEIPDPVQPKSPQPVTQPLGGGEGAPNPIPIPPVKPTDPEEPIKTTASSEKVGCLGRIKRLLRWISYRFWALFWLFIYTLLIIWLCRYCDRPNCDAYCEKLKKTKEELKRLEERVRERCDTTYIKSR